MVPIETPVTTPDNEPIVATNGLRLLQVPPVVVFVSVDVVPMHTVVIPLMGLMEPPLVTVIVLIATAVPQLLVIL